MSFGFKLQNVNALKRRSNHRKETAFTLVREILILVPARLPGPQDLSNHAFGARSKTPKLPQPKAHPIRYSRVPSPGSAAVLRGYQTKLT